MNYERNIQTLFMKNIFSDFKIMINESELDCIHTHKMILCLYSGFFRGYLNSNPEAGSVELKSLNLDAAAFKKVIFYLYSKEILFESHKEALAVLRLADYFSVDSLVDYILVHLSVTLDITTCLTIFNTLVDYLIKHSLLNDCKCFLDKLPEYLKTFKNGCCSLSQEFQTNIHTTILKLYEYILLNVISLIDKAEDELFNFTRRFNLQLISVIEKQLPNLSDFRSVDKTISFICKALGLNVSELMGYIHNKVDVYLDLFIANKVKPLIEANIDVIDDTIIVAEIKAERRGIVFEISKDINGYHLHMKQRSYKQNTLIQFACFAYTVIISNKMFIGSCIVRDSSISLASKKLFDFNINPKHITIFISEVPLYTATLYLIINKFEDILKSNPLRLKYQDIEHILDDPSLKVSNENIVFKTLMDFFLNADCVEATYINLLKYLKIQFVESKLIYEAAIKFSQLLGHTVVTAYVYKYLLHFSKQRLTKEIQTYVNSSAVKFLIPDENWDIPTQEEIFRIDTKRKRIRPCYVDTYQDSQIINRQDFVSLVEGLFNQFSLPEVMRREVFIL
jgi:hypothetical protein